MKKRIIIFIIVYIAFAANLLLYSFCFRAYGNESTPWMIWSFSQYVTFFATIFSVEKILRNAIFPRKIWVDLIFIATLILILCGGYSLSVIAKPYLLMMTIIEALVILAFGISSILVLIKINRAPRREKNQKINTEEIETDVFNYLSRAKSDKDAPAHVSLSLALCFSTVVYIAFLACIVFANVVCKKVETRHIVVAIVLALLALLFNQLKLNKYRPNNIKLAMLENILLAVAFALYLSIEWLVMPVTFNLFLAAGCLGLLIPIHITQVRLCDDFYAAYKNRNKATAPNEPQD